MQFFWLPHINRFFITRFWGIVWIVLMSPFSWQCQNPCKLSLTSIIDWRAVQGTPPVARKANTWKMKETKPDLTNVLLYRRRPIRMRLLKMSMDSKSHSRHRSMCLPSPTIHTRLNDHCKLRSGFWRPGPWIPQRRSRTMLVWRPSVGRRPRIPREWKATLFTRARLDHLRRTILILSPTIHRWLDLLFTVSECTGLIHMLLSAGKRDLLFWYSNNSIRTFKRLSKTSFNNDQPR